MKNIKTITLTLLAIFALQFAQAQYPYKIKDTVVCLRQKKRKKTTDRLIQIFLRCIRKQTLCFALVRSSDASQILRHVFNTLHHVIVH